MSMLLTNEYNFYMIGIVGVTVGIGYCVSKYFGYVSNKKLIDDNINLIKNNNKLKEENELLLKKVNNHINLEENNNKLKEENDILLKKVNNLSSDNNIINSKEKIENSDFLDSSVHPDIQTEAFIRVKAHLREFHRIFPEASKDIKIETLTNTKIKGLVDDKITADIAYKTFCRLTSNLADMIVDNFYNTSFFFIMLTFTLLLTSIYTYYYIIRRIRGRRTFPPRQVIPNPRTIQKPNNINHVYDNALDCFKKLLGIFT